MSDTSTSLDAMSKQGELRSDQTKPNKTVSLKGADSTPYEDVTGQDQPSINNDKMYRVHPITIHDLKKKATHIWQYTEPGCRTVEEGNELLKEISRIVDEIVELEQTTVEVK
tara:strand:- start:23 stop:358 length:336 start_codon:yes stop_codon:yes gene_type:complete